MQYRAWGAVKHTDYGDGKTVDATYTARLQAATFQIPGLMSKTYDYHADNRLRFSSDLIDHRLDRSYSFDHAARINVALSGAEARGEGASQDRPYWETFDYDAIGHLTERATFQWTSQQMTSSDSYTNNRHNPVGSLWQYDADGNLLGSPGNSYTYDAAGRVDTVWSGSAAVLGLDGDGRQVRSAETVYDPQTQTETTTTKYYVHSTVLGGEVLTELEPASQYSRSFVYAGGAVLATQERWFSQTEQISWEHRDPSNATFRTTSASTVTQLSELDPVGADMSVTDPNNTQTIPDEGSLAPYPSLNNPAQPNMTYSIDGVRVPLDHFMVMFNLNFKSNLQLAEASARASAPKLTSYSVSRFHGRLIKDFGLNLDGAYNEALEEGNITRNWLVDSNWDFDSSLVPQNPGVQFLRDNSGNTSYGPGKEKMIFDAILALYTDDCINAFKAEGLKDPFTLVTGLGGGVVIGPSSLAMNPSNVDYMGVPEQARQQILREFGNSSTKAFAVRGQFTSDGRPRIFLNASAFANGLGGLVSVMAHETIHGANVKGVTPPWYMKWQDDLSFDPKYQKIINTCRNAAQSFIDTRR